MGVSIGADFAIYLIFRIREEAARRDALDAAIRDEPAHLGQGGVLRRRPRSSLGYLVLPFSGFSIWTAAWASSRR